MRCVLYPVAAAALLATGVPAVAQPTYPTKPVRIIVPYPPGGAVDAVARIVGQRLAEGFGQNHIIDNRTGANGVIGGEIAARAAPDGYTLLSTASIHIINPLVLAKVPYDPVRDFAPVSEVAAGPLLLVAHPALPATNARDLIAFGKANPGKLTAAISSRGAAGHLATEMIKFMGGIDFLIVPYKGSGPAYTDLIGGQVQFMMDPILASLPHVRGGRLKALGVTSVKRVAMAPEIPTVAESGLAGFDFYSWYGIWAPKGTPATIVNRIAAEVAKLVKLPEVNQRLTGQGFEPIGSNPAEFARYIDAEFAKYGKIVRAAGIKPE